MKTGFVSSVLASFFFLTLFSGFGFAFNVNDVSGDFNFSAGNLDATYTLILRITNGSAINATNYTNVTFYLPYGMVNSSACTGTKALEGINLTYSACRVQVTNGDGTPVDVSLTVKLNISAFSENSVVMGCNRAGNICSHGNLGPVYSFMTAICASGCSLNTTLNSQPRYGVQNYSFNPRPYFVNNSGTFGSNVSITVWNQTDPAYVIQLPIMTFNATSRMPQYSNNSFGDVLYFDKNGQMEMPTYMRLYSYLLNFTFLDTADDSRFVLYNPVNASTSCTGMNPGNDCPPESIMPLLTQNQSNTDPVSNQTFNMTISIPSPSGYDLYVNGTLRAINFSVGNESGYWGINASFVAGMGQNGGGALTINVTNAEKAMSTTYGLYFTVMNQTNDTGQMGPGQLYPTSPIYVVNQSISGWDPMSPPAFGENLTVSYIAWFRNALSNWTFYNASVRYFIPVNATPRSPTNDSDFQTCAYASDAWTNCTINMSTNMNFSWITQGKTGWDDTGVGTNTSCVVFTDSRPGEESGGNVTVCFTTYDLNLVNADFNNWIPNSTTSIVGVNFTANIAFPAMEESETPAGGTGQNQYNVTFQNSITSNFNLTDKVPNISSAGCDGTTITLDGTALTCASNYTIGSLTLNSVSQGSHTVGVSYTISSSGSSSGVSGSGGCVGSGCATPTPSATASPTAKPSVTPTPSATPSTIEKTRLISNSFGVKGSFQTGNTFLTLEYTSPRAFNGILRFILPLEYSDYANGFILFNPKPLSVKSGSIVAEYLVDLMENQKFTATVNIKKTLNPRVLNDIKQPAAITSSATPAAALATPSAAPTAAGTDYTLALVFIGLVLIAAYYFGVMRKKR